MNMNKKEVIKAIERKIPKRIPILYKWIAHETWDKYGNKLKTITCDYEDDFVIVSYNAYSKEGVNEWGLKFEEATVGSRVVNHPLDSWEKLPEFLSKFSHIKVENKFKDFVPLWVHAQLFEEHPFEKLNLEETIKRYQDKGKYIIGLQFPVVNELFMQLIPPEKYWTDLYINPDNIVKLGDKFVEYYCKIIDNYARLGVNGVWFSDDWGMQDRIQISPKIWRKIFKSWYKILFDQVHRYNMHAFFHCCGYIEDIIPDFIELGLDVLHLGQPYVMNIKKIVSNFKKDICFFGGCDVQSLPKKRPEEVEKDVEEVVKLFGAREGGFILAPTNSITPDVSLENIKALFSVMKNYSLYYNIINII